MNQDKHFTPPFKIDNITYSVTITKVLKCRKLVQINILSALIITEVIKKKSELVFVGRFLNIDWRNLRTL